MTITITASLEIDLDSEEQAERVRAALDVDSDDYATLVVDGRRLVAEATGKPGTVWNTMDDVLACLSVAVEVDGASDEAGEPSA